MAPVAAVAASYLQDLARVTGHRRLADVALDLGVRGLPEPALRARRLVGGGQVLTGPLSPILQWIRLSEASPPSAAHAVLPVPVDEPAYPIRTWTQDEWEQALGRCLDGLATDLARCGHDPANLLVVLERWASWVPALAEKAEDGPAAVSFYDQVRLAAAVAGCLEAGDQGLPFLLVGGDLSGIQRFLYTINPRRALRSLRARSLYLGLVAEHAVASLLGPLERCHLLYNGGGRFYLLLPNAAGVWDRIRTVQERLNTWLLDQFGGSVALAIGCQAFGEQDYPRAADAVLPHVLEHLNRDKGRKFAPQLQIPGFWDAGPREDEVDACDVCQAETSRLSRLEAAEYPGDEPPRVCDTCKALAGVGRLLADERYGYLVVLPADPTGRAGHSGLVGGVQVMDRLYVLVDRLDRFPQAERVYSLGRWEVGAVPLPYCRYEAQEGQTDKLAGVALGLDRIAALRMDVDHLGAIFGRGLPAARRDLAHVAALSRQISLFFSCHLAHLCAGKAYPGFQPFQATQRPFRGREVLVVYAGGDDLFLVGAWDHVAELAFDIAAAFSQYAAGNPDVHLSGGMALGYEDTPISALARRAGDAEDEAKEAGRNAMAFFTVGGSTVVLNWQDATHVAQTVLKPLLSELGEYDGRRVELRFSRALLHRLVQVALEWREQGLLAHPRLAYALRRAEEEMARQPGGVPRAWGTFKDQLLKGQGLQNALFALLWADLASRVKEEKRDAG